jgi:succinoglycan biosynthesis protein ExoU
LTADKLWRASARHVIFAPVRDPRIQELSSVDAARSIAVIITAKNAAATAAHAVSSALAQSPVSEVIFVDDGSTDETSAVARAEDDGSGRLKIIQLEKNKGPAHGRNVAIAASSAPLLCILDADDFMGAHRLERLLQLGGEGWDLLADNMMFTADPTEDQVFDTLLPADVSLPRDLSLSEFALGNLHKKVRYRRELGFLKPVIRRSFLDAHGLRYDERLRLGEDMLLYAGCLIEDAVFRVVEACGYYAVERPESLSGSHTTQDIAAFHQALVELESRAAAAGRPIAELSACVRSTRNNLALRQALDAKRANGWAGFLSACGRTPASLPYMARTLARARLDRVSHRVFSR